MPILQTLLSDLQSTNIEVLDLTAPLSSQTPILHLPEPFANTIPLSLDRLNEFGDDGATWSWNNIHMGEHTGTHLDAPAHWISGRNGRSVDQIPPTRLIGPAVVIDKVAEVATDPDFLLEPADFESWQDEHGSLPEGGWLLFRTGWSVRSNDTDQFLNADEKGPHSPGLSAAAAKWLAENTTLSGYGVETVGVDAGKAGGLDPAFPAHFYLLGSDKYGLTQLQNLDRLPVQGAVLVVSPLPIVGGTGSPARVFALVEKNGAAV